MWLRDQYRIFLSYFYRHIFDGPCIDLKVTGIIHFINRHNIWIGSNVLLKRNCELNPSANTGKQAIVIGNNSEIHENTVLRTFEGHIHIGDYSSINRWGYIWGSGGVDIGSRVRIGPRVNITSSNHIFKDRSRPIMEQGLSTGPITIADDV